MSSHSTFKSLKGLLKNSYSRPRGSDAILRPDRNINRIPKLQKVSTKTKPIKLPKLK